MATNGAESTNPRLRQRAANLQAARVADLTSDVTASDDLVAGDDLVVTDDATIGGTLGVTGLASATGGLVVGTGEGITGGIVNIVAMLPVSVTVPSITDHDIAQVAVDVSSLTLGIAVGDIVLGASPAAAMPTNARLLGVYVTATDEVTFVFGSEGGNVTGAATNFNLLIADVA